MAPRFPEAIPVNGRPELNIAPGEGKIPTSFLSEEDWDIYSFPNLHLSGKNGVHHNNQHQQYFEQRLKKQDPWFEQCTPYVFAAAAFIEEKQLERNIVVSYSKGKVCK